MTIKSKEGYYVKGTVSELMLDQVKEGTILNCSSQNGDFEAEVIDVSEYPVSGDNYSGNGNPNVSYYTYIATKMCIRDRPYIPLLLRGQHD